MKAVCFVLLCILLFASQGAGQTEDGDHLRVSPSKFKLRAKGVRFEGRRPNSTRDYQGRIIYEGFAYYFSDDDLDGLVAEDLKTGARTIYEPTELALSAGWLKRSASKKESGEGDETLRNQLRGYQRSGDTIWMGTDGFGILVFDTKKRVWARYDTEAEVRPGKDGAGVFYADDDYVFAGGFNVYSRRRKSWIKVDAIPTRYVSHFGYAGIQVQRPWDLTKYAREKFLPLDAEGRLYVLWWPERVTLREDGEAYIFSSAHDEALTEFTIEKWQLEWAFSQMEIKTGEQQ